MTSHNSNDGMSVIAATAVAPPACSKPTSTCASSSLDMTEFGLHLAMELLGPARVMEHIELLERFTPFETLTGSAAIGSVEDRPPPLFHIPPLYWRSRLFIPTELTTDRTTPPTAAAAAVKEERRIWLWQALMNLTSQHPDGSVLSDQVGKHSLLYFDVTFAFVKKSAVNPMIPSVASGASGNSELETTMLGSIEVFLGLCFAHYVGGGACPGISDAEYFTTYPLLSSNLEDHLNSMKFDINSVGSDKLASMMAVEFLRQGGSPIPQSLGGEPFDVTYPEISTIDIGCESEIQMNIHIPYPDVILKSGVLVLTTKGPVTETERYTNTQLKHIYRDLVQDLHYYDEDQRSRGTSQLDAVVQSNSSPKSKLLSPRSNVLTVGRAGESATKTGANVCGVKRSLDMTDSVAHADRVTAEDGLRSQVVKAFDEWKARQPSFPPASARDIDAKKAVNTNDSTMMTNAGETSAAVQGTEENGGSTATTSTGSPIAEENAKKPPVFPKKSKPYRRRRAR